MDSNKKFISRMIQLYGLIVILSNIIAVLVPTVISTPILDSQNMQNWNDFISRNHFSNYAIIAAFLVPTLVCVIYSRKIFKSEEKMMKNLAEIPSVYSLSSVIGWNLYYLIEIPFVIYAKVKLGIHIKFILISSWGFALFSGMTAYTISYILIEILNRMIMLPKAFPGGHIQKNGFSFRPVFKHLMFFCFMVSSVFPVILLLTSLISEEVNYGLKVHSGIIFISFLMLTLAFIITKGLTKIIISPLNKLTAAAGRIKDGDYKTRAGVVTADELGILADSFNDLADSLAEKEFMRDTFGKVVDPEVRDYLLRGNAGAAVRGGETREVTVLFCDIRSFTAMSEKMSAEDVVSLLNRYFTALGKCITAHHGIINKYIGDAIMAIFGAPVAVENSARDAYEAALDMRKALAELNRELAQGESEIARSSRAMTEGDVSAASTPHELHFGIGIHTGPVFAGTIGAENRMEYTVIGDTVNTASRLESLCKTYKVDLLMSEAAAKKTALPEGELKFIDNAEIRGKAEPMKVYTA